MKTIKTKENNNNKSHIYSNNSKGNMIYILESIYHFGNAFFYQI